MKVETLGHLIEWNRALYQARGLIDPVLAMEQHETLRPAQQSNRIRDT